MAKSKKTKYTEDSYVSEDFVSNEDKVQPKSKTDKILDPIADKVRNLRVKGFDSDRIAAMLNVRKDLVDKVK